MSPEEAGHQIFQYVWSKVEPHGAWWLNQVYENPGHFIVESFLLFFILYILLFKKTLNTKATAIDITHLNEKEINELISEWNPDPLVPELSEEEISKFPIIQSYKNDEIVVTNDNEKEKSIFNMSTFDFLGFGQSDEIKQAAIAAMEKYGCGSCGPRGFYGTIDVHLKFEENAAKFMRTEAAICYSDSAATTTSCIAAFSKKGDMILADNGVHEAVCSGLDLSRSTVRYFEHNNMEHLEKLLCEVEEEDRITRRNTLDQRRFIVVEGLYRNYGDICPLRELVELKRKYKYRLIVDEAFSFGVLGHTGRGVVEYFKLESADTIDILTFSLAHTLASVGGVCAGREDVVDHQRLSGGGYCFSAAAPPFTAAAASASIALLERTGPHLIEVLRKNSQHFHRLLAMITSLKVISVLDSPIIHAVMRGVGEKKLEKEEHLKQIGLLRKVADICMKDGFAIAVSHYMSRARHQPPPSLRFTVTATQSVEKLDKCAKSVQRAVEKVFAQK